MNGYWRALHSSILFECQVLNADGRVHDPALTFKFLKKKLNAVGRAEHTSSTFKL